MHLVTIPPRARACPLSRERHLIDSELCTGVLARTDPLERESVVLYDALIRDGPGLPKPRTPSVIRAYCKGIVNPAAGGVAGGVLRYITNPAEA